MNLIFYGRDDLITIRAIRAREVADLYNGIILDSGALINNEWFHEKDLQHSTRFYDAILRLKTVAYEIDFDDEAAIPYDLGYTVYCHLSQIRETIQRLSRHIMRGSIEYK
jgi:hypothetical protein